MWKWDNSYHPDSMEVQQSLFFWLSELKNISKMFISLVSLKKNPLPLPRNACSMVVPFTIVFTKYWPRKQPYCKTISPSLSTKYEQWKAWHTQLTIWIPRTKPNYLLSLRATDEIYLGMLYGGCIFCLCIGDWAQKKLFHKMISPSLGIMYHNNSTYPSLNAFSH